MINGMFLTMDCGTRSHLDLRGAFTLRSNESMTLLISIGVASGARGCIAFLSEELFFNVDHTCHFALIQFLKLNVEVLLNFTLWFI